MVLTHNAILEQVIEIQLDLYLADGFVSHYLYSLDDPLLLCAAIQKDQQETGYPVLPLDRIADYRSGLPDWEATAIEDIFKIIMANVAPSSHSVADTLARLSVRETAQRIW